MKTALLVLFLFRMTRSIDLVNGTDLHPAILRQHQHEEDTDFAHSELVRLIIISVALYLILISCTYCCRLCESKTEKWARQNRDQYVKDETVLDV